MWDQHLLNLTQSVRSLYFLDSREGWMTTVEADDEEMFIVGRVLHTLDAGLTWSEILVDSMETFSSVIFTDANHGAVTCDRGILTTTDGGLSWQNNSPFSLPMKQVCRAGMSGLCAFGNGSTILRSDNQGTTWQQISSGYAGGYWNTIAFLDSRHGWVGGSSKILRTTDGGRRWDLIPSFRYTFRLQRSCCTG